MRISVPRNFSFESTVESHGWYLLAPFRWSRSSGKLQRAEAIDGRAFDVEISFDRDARAIHVAAGGSSRRLAAALEKRIARMFQLGIDTSEFVAMAQRSPEHAWVASAGFGRLLCGSTPFEDIVKIIATTNTTWRQTMRMIELLVEKCGKRSESGRAAFPEAAEVAQFEVEELKSECRLGYRAKSIHALAKAIAEGTIDLDRVADPSQKTEELFRSYRTLPGIGPYGAAHLLAMDGRHDFIAVDTDFRRFVRERYHSGRIVSDRTLLKRYARWGRWKYLAYWSELWRSVAEALRPGEGDE